MKINFFNIDLVTYTERITWTKQQCYVFSKGTYIIGEHQIRCSKLNIKDRVELWY